MNDTLTVGSLFSGIGGFDLGFERAGMRTAWFCEQDPFCQRVLAKHWPRVPCHNDVCAISGDSVEPVDVLCGGFPCQDISAAGKGAGITGARSGLWSEFARLVGDLRPRYVVVENVPLLRKRGLETVLADLLACGYDAEWDGISASTVGAPHRRDRIWIIAYPQLRGDGRLADTDGECGPVGRASGDVASETRAPEGDGEQRERSGYAAHDCGPTVSNARSEGLERHGGANRDASQEPDLECASWWATEPDVGRVAHGVPARVDRLRALGNALVPQIAQLIGERIVSYEAHA